QLFPNPADDQLTVLLPPELGPTIEWQVVDVLGKRLPITASIEAGQLRLEVEALSPGIYWLLLQTREGVFRQQFVRQ
ncbi:MAG: T9SS type A sorting domain-containing protein, partial [Bacteroidota bacterium]